MSLNSYKIGDTIFKCQPLVRCLRHEKKRRLCDHCFGPIRPTIAKSRDCGLCHRMHFCSQECQLEDLAIHELECDILRQYYSPCFEHHFFRTILRLYLMVINDSQYLDIQYKTYDGTDRSLKDLMTHSEDILSDTERLKRFVYIRQTLRYLSNEFNFRMNSDLLFRLFCQITINYFGIVSYVGTREALSGTGLYIEASVLNHSCDPNAATVYFGPTLVLKAIKPIATGDEITINYVDFTLDPFRRQTALLKSFYFRCLCHRCESNESHFKYKRIVSLRYQILNESLKVRPDWSLASKLSDHLLRYCTLICDKTHPQLITLFIDVLKVKLKNKCEDIWALDDFIDDLQQRIELIFGTNHDIYKAFKKVLKTRG